MKRLGVFVVVFVVFFSVFCIGDDFSVVVKLSDEIYTNVEYDKLYTVKNHDWRSNRIMSDIVVNYYLLDEFDEILLDEELEITSLKSSKTSKTGLIHLQEPGDYYFCAEIIETSLEDNNQDNDLDCKEISVIGFDDGDVFNDFQVTVVLSDVIFSELEYYDLFKIENLGWGDFKIETNLTINYYIFDENNDLVFEDETFVEGLKSSKKSKTGIIYIEDEGNYTFCAEIIQTSFDDDNEENNLNCKNILAIDSSNVPCNMSIGIDSKDYFYSNETSFRFDFVVSNEEFYPDVEFWVEDMFGYIVQDIDEYEVDDNYYGRMYKSNIGEVYDYQNIVVKANITKPWCYDSDYSDNLAEKMIVVKNPTYYTFQEYEINPYIIVEAKNKGTINFGDRFYVEIEEAWSGDMSGRIKIWVEDNKTKKKISESIVSIGMPKMSYIEDLKIPIELKDNCDRKFDDGNYSIVYEGFGFKDNIFVDVGGIDNRICRSDNSKKDSSISIDKVKYKSGDYAKLGESIRAEVNVYKGDTGKSSLRAYVVDDRNKRISSYDSKFLLKTKYQKYDLTIPIQLKPLCDEKTDERDYTLIVRGLDLETKELIEIDGNLPTLCKYHDKDDESNKKVKKRKGSFDAEFASYPSKVRVGELFYVEVKLENNKDEDIGVDIWSNIVKGRKKFGENNKKNVQVKEGESVNVKLLGSVDEIDPGEYELKVGMDRSDIKTNKYLRESILVESSEKNDTCVIYQGFAAVSDVNETFETKVFESATTDKYSYKYDKDIEQVKPVTGTVIYESSTVRASKLVPYIIIFMLLVLCVVLVVWKV